MPVPQEKLIAILSDVKLSTFDIQTCIGHSLNDIRLGLRALEEKGLAKRVGANTATFWLASAPEDFEPIDEPDVVPPRTVNKMTGVYTPPAPAPVRAGAMDFMACASVGFAC